MKKLLTISFVAGMAALIACGPSKKDQEVKEKQKEKQKQEQDSIDSADRTKKKADSLIIAINLERDRIENNLKSFQIKSLSTKTLREQIKQKWSKIEFCTEKDQIVRIKTYPYKEITNRTEEFYFQKGKLMLAFICDNGLLIKEGKPEKGLGKTYYFSEDAVIKEENLSNEKETSIRNSDSERLLQEAKEYLELYSTK